MYLVTYDAVDDKEYKIEVWSHFFKNKTVKVNHKFQVQLWEGVFLNKYVLGLRILKHLMWSMTYLKFEVGTFWKKEIRVKITFLSEVKGRLKISIINKQENTRQQQFITFHINLFGLFSYKEMILINILNKIKWIN